MAPLTKFVLRFIILVAMFNIIKWFMFSPTIVNLKTSKGNRRQLIKSNNFTKEFVYLVQCEQCLSNYYMQQDVLGNGEQHDIIALSYGKKCKQKHSKHVKYITSPFHTTWTSGRNFLYSYISSNETSKYMYYIFIDEDLVLKDNTDINTLFHKQLDTEGKLILNQKISPWRKFESFLSSYQPAVGIADGTINMKLLLQKRGNIVPAYIFPGMAIDAMFNAFHYNAINGLLPYDDRYDKISWWVSQEIMQCRMFFQYHAHVVTFMSVIVNNTLHRKYPKKSMNLKQACWKEMKLIPRYMKYSHITQGWMKKRSYRSINQFTYVAPALLPIKKYKYFVDDYCSNKCALQKQWHL